MSFSSIFFYDRTKIAWKLRTNSDSSEMDCKDDHTEDESNVENVVMLSIIFWLFQVCFFGTVTFFVALFVVELFFLCFVFGETDSTTLSAVEGATLWAFCEFRVVGAGGWHGADEFSRKACGATPS
jgi:hypothetical protein